MDLTAALGWAATHRHGVLITLRRDGRAQSSDIAYMVDGADIVISVTTDRAKTANLRRDPRAVVHVTDPTAWSYVSFDGTAALSPVASAVDDETCDELCAYYESVAGRAHPDWHEYRQAMVDEGRLLLRITPSSAVGQIRD